ncbi:RidA family protein [Marinicrinis lubricantis]|uniref:RidA family protein n=1 Tax=Marinicrinis lubricantis TaxID=2086470 RepID=A0ABW1INM2_9BACL
MNTESIEEKLQSMGIRLPEASGPAAKYVNAVIVNGLMFVSGKGPGSQPKGKLGKDFSTEEGYLFARETAVEVLAAVKEQLGSLDKVKRVVKIQGFVNADPSFEEHHKVLNGCSDLLIELFGEKGLHARSVFGAVSVRDQLPIIIDSIFEVEY